MPKKYAVIDGNSLMHRAYHAVPPTMNAPDGTPTNAVFGFLSMFLKLVDMVSPDAVVCAFDAGKPAFRIAALEQYKAQRPPMDDELRVQFPIMEEILTSMNVPVIKVQGWEGDDILGTVAARNEALGNETLLITGDKDACQLASPLTSVVTTKKGITDVVVMGPDEVYEKYGVTPDQFPDFLGLMGDSSDNIPGVPGIGPKTATKLLQKYGSLQGIYENLSDLKGKQLENLQNNEQAAYLSREIATIVRDLDFPLDLEACAFPSFEPEVVEETFSKYRMNSHLVRVLRLAGAQVKRFELDLKWQPVLKGGEGKRALAQAIETGELIGLALDEPEQVSLFDAGVRVAFAMDQACAILEGDEAVEALAALVREGRCAVLAFKEILGKVLPRDGAEAALVTQAEALSARVFDVALAGYVLNSSLPSYALEQLLGEYGLGSLPEGKNADEKAAIRAAAARYLVKPMTEALEREGSIRAYCDIDMPLVAVLACMERTGAAIDAKRLEDLGKSTQEALDVLSEQIYAAAGEPFNIDSPKQLSHILFEVLGLPPLKKNTRGYSTDASVLKELAKEHELPALVLRYREMAKIKSTYIDALPRMRKGDGLVHTQFNEMVTTTGRLSSSDPNLQNIPVRTDFGRQIRECFIPLAPGEVFFSADYSQIELRLLAHLSGDEHLVAAFNSGMDFHASTAARVFGVALEEVTPELRSRAKAVNFGIVYGQQAYGLSQSLDIPFGEAKDMIDRYFEAYPGVRAYLDQTVEKAREDGFAETMFGRKRHIPELKARNAQQRGFGERTAMNHPMQGSAADIIKMAMNEVQRRLLAEGFKAKLMIQVHDELDFSVPRDEVDRLAVMVREVMEGVVSLKVPLVVDASWGDNWAEAH